MEVKHLNGFALTAPQGDRAALRLVGWKTKEAGWMDNLRGTRLYPGDVSTAADNFTVDNASLAKDDYNTLDTIGARAALRIDANQGWDAAQTIAGKQECAKRKGQCRKMRPALPPAHLARI